MTAALLLLAGFIDSIVGGGGLITLPSLKLHGLDDIHAIATNKIFGSAAAGMALLMYLRAQKLPFKDSIHYLLAVLMGSYLGSRIAPLLPNNILKYQLIIAAPIILYVIFRSKIWKKHELPQEQVTSRFILSLMGFACGVYDGSFGPGGGVFMFLALYVFTSHSLLSALVISKAANFISASISLISYATQGFVLWSTGLKYVLFLMAGAAAGSLLVTKKLQKIVRPALVLVVLLILAKLASI